jgi:hypothetical protein
MRLGHSRNAEVKGETDANRAAILDDYLDKVGDSEGLVGELCSCQGARLHGTTPKGATTTAWAHAVHRESIEDRKIEKPEEASQYAIELSQTEYTPEPVLARDTQFRQVE